MVVLAFFMSKISLKSYIGGSIKLIGFMTILNKELKKIYFHNKSLYLN
jgi:hypothetical protein